MPTDALDTPYGVAVQLIREMRNLPQAGSIDELMVALKISVVNGDLTNEDVMIFLKAGGSLDKNQERNCPFGKWMSEKVWLNAIQLTRHSFGREQVPVFKDLTEHLARNDIGWRKWFDESEPDWAWGIFVGATLFPPL
eukprot:s1199_g3.t1